MSTSFQHHRFYSNLDSLGLENELRKSYHNHSQSTKRLGSQAYTKKIKYCSNICSPSYDSQISSNESSSDEEYNHFHDKSVHFLTTNSRKGKYSSHQSHKKHKKLTSPVKWPTSPVRENIFPMREQRKSPEREDQSIVKLTSKTGKKQQNESKNSGKRKKVRPSKNRFLISMPHKQMAIIQNLKESHSVCRAWILIKFKKLTINVAINCMKKWVTLFAVILLPESVKQLQRQ